jgi:hypothetical protein
MDITVYGFLRRSGYIYERASNYMRSRFIGVPFAAVRLCLALAASALLGCIWTEMTLPQIPDVRLLLLALVALDCYCAFASPSVLSRTVPIVAYSLAFLVAASIAGIFATYSTQRLAMPLQDELFLAADRALGVDWLAFVHFIDDRPRLATLFGLSYGTMDAQILAPVLLLAVYGNIGEMRVYLLAFATALAATIVIAALLPASSAYTLVDAGAFHDLRFTGKTPLDHLAWLRKAGPLDLAQSSIGGLLSFPSFHAVVAVLTPLALRSIRPAFYALCFIDAAMLVGTITEGGHYVIDPIGGAAVACLSYAFAMRTERRRSVAWNHVERLGREHDHEKREAAFGREQAESMT